MRRLKVKHENGLTYILGHMPSTNIHGQLQDYLEKQTEEVKQCSVELRKMRPDLSSKEAERNMIGKQIKDQEVKLSNLEEKIYDTCGSQNFEEGLKSAHGKMTQAQNTRGQLQGAQHFLKKYENDLDKANPCCPLCHREFNSEQEIRDLIQELQEDLRKVPTRMREAERELKTSQTKYDDMVQLKPLRENIITISDTELPAFRNKQRRLNEDIERLQIQVQDKEDEQQAKEVDEVTAKNMHPDMSMVERYLGEIKDLDKKIAVQKSQLSDGDEGRTLDDVINVKKEKQLHLDTLNRKLEHKRQKLNDHSERIQKLRSKVNSLREEKLKIDADLQQQTKLEESKVNLQSENERNVTDIEEARSEIKPLQIQIDRNRQEKEKLLHSKEEQMEKGRTEVDGVRAETGEVKTFNKAIRQYNQSHKADMLDRCNEKVSEVVAKEISVTDDRDDIAENMNKLSKDVARQKIRERELTDNQQLREKKKEMGRLDQKIGDLGDQLGDMDTKNLERERRKLHQKANDLQEQRNIGHGRKVAAHEQKRNITRDLKSDLFCDAALKYRDKMIEMRTTELANGDLEKYYRAMDKAIMNFHIQKMDEINKIIRELWRKTYKGNDIETIEIRTDDDDGAVLKARRVYNYRVVMVKGDIALDMRGRCSAGQKVLASLIIRMALAETFCVNCGILALDEPTTNLDRENIESLAFALVEIIKGRQQQRNFQLIVITHDEDFVELLGRSEYVDEFYQIGKNKSGSSRIVRSSVANLHMRLS